jgi:hypothetical protein
VLPVQRDLVPVFWPLVAPMLQKAVDEAAGELALDDVYARMLDQRMQLLIAAEGTKILAAFVTEVVNYPKKRSLRVVLAGGRGARKWRGQLLEVLRAGAKAIGASTLETFGRGGWVKIFQPYPSVKLKYYVLVEEL